MIFSLAGSLISWQSTGSVNSTPSAHTFFSCSFCQRACPSLLSLSFRLQPQSRTDSTHTRGSRSTLFVSCLKTVTPHRAMSYGTRHLSITPAPGTCTPSLSSTQSSSHPPFSQLRPSADLRPHLSGALAAPIHHTSLLWNTVSHECEVGS